MWEAQTIAGLLLATGALAGAALLLMRGRDWRTVVLAGLTLVSALALYIALFPPQLPIGGETLVVATAQSPASIEAAPGERLVALPEAPAIERAQRVPDLATALRRHEQVQRIRIEGRGLTRRDRDVDAGMPVAFTPLAVPSGITLLEPPEAVPAGSAFTLAVEVTGIDESTIELIDPAGRSVDRRAISGGGRFVLGGTSRKPGLASFTVRLRGENREVISDTPVPVRVLEERPVRALLVGTPSPENKYLRRWAQDSGIDLTSRLETGGGIDVGNARIGLGSASLAQLDVLIIDDRSLLQLGSGSRAAVARALDGGLGVVVKMTGPASSGSRSAWRSLGLAVEGGSDIAPISPPSPASDAQSLSALRGPGSEESPSATNSLDDAVPALDRWTVRAGQDFVDEVVDADGQMLAGWQQSGRGRVALWTPANSYALVLGGRSELYYQWWSDIVSAVARADRLFSPEVTALARTGERVTICELSGTARVTDPEGNSADLAVDPLAGAKGCAAYWPAISGVHTIEQADDGGTQQFSFMVLPEGTLAAARAREIGEETSIWAARQTPQAAPGQQQRRGPRWPYLLVWLIVSGALWYLERRWRARISANREEALTNTGT